MAALITKGEAFEDGSAINMARAIGTTGSNLTQAAISTITYSVFQKNNGAVVVSSTSLTVSAVIFDTLQTPAIWTRDQTGYNFRHDAAATTMPQGDTTYRFEYKITLTSGSIVWLVFEVYSKAIFTS